MAPPVTGLDPSGDRNDTMRGASANREALIELLAEAVSRGLIGALSKVCWRPRDGYEGPPILELRRTSRASDCSLARRVLEMF